MQSLQKACEDGGSTELISFDTSKWTFQLPEAAIFLSCRMPNLTHYLSDALREIMLRLYEERPPQADMAWQNVTQIDDLYNLCRYVCDLLGSSIHLSDLNLDEWFAKYKQKASLTEDEMQSSSLQSQVYDQHKKNCGKKKRNKKKRQQEIAYEQPDNSASGDDPQQSPEIQGGSSKNRGSSESSSGSNQPNEASSADKSDSDNKDSKQLAQKPFINKEQLPQLLLDIAYGLYQAETIEVALTGSAVPALYRDRPDKVRDYDCLAVAEGIDTVKHLLMRNGLVDADDESNVNDSPSHAPRFKLIKAKDRTILVVSHGSTKKIELNTVKPEIGKSNTQVLNEVMGHHLTVSDALFVNLSNALEKRQTTYRRSPRWLSGTGSKTA